MDCKTCKEKEKQAQPVPFAAFESMQASKDLTIRRLWVVIILLICLIVAGVAAWIYYDSQFVDEEWTFEASTDNGGNAIANGNGEVNYYGYSESYPSEENP